MDECVHICLRSIRDFDDDTLVEEIFAMINTCLISDSGILAVKGLRRLESFVSSDLPAAKITDDTWATISHMLRRCLCIRDLPRRSSSPFNSSGNSASDVYEKVLEDNKETITNDLEYQEMINEFKAEDNIFADRRYIGSNAIYIIGNFLEAERFTNSLSVDWRIFLISGVGKSIKDWEVANTILAQSSPKNSCETKANPPSYLETAMYGRKYMNRFLLMLATLKETGDKVEEGNSNKQSATQELIQEQTQNLVTAFLEREAVSSSNTNSSNSEVKSFDILVHLIQDMMAGYAKLSDERLSSMSWLNPVLSSCIHTSNEDIRLNIQKLVKRLH